MHINQHYLNCNSKRAISRIFVSLFNTFTAEFFFKNPKFRMEKKHYFYTFSRPFHIFKKSKQLELDLELNVDLN